jgi:hypothetical protein
MKTVSLPQLLARVTAFDRTLADNAAVSLEPLATASGKKAAPIKAEYDKRRDCFVAQIPQAGSYIITAGSGGYEPQQRQVNLVSGTNEELFILGRKGMPVYFRGRVPVPFEPLPGYLGIVARHLVRTNDAAVAALNQLVARFGLTAVNTHPNLLRNRLQIYKFPATAPESQQADIQSTIASNEFVELCSPVLRLLEKNATLLTRNLIIKFNFDITISEVQILAREFNLTLIRHIP